MAKRKFVLVILSLVVVLIITACFFLFIKNKKITSRLQYPDANVILILIDTLRADHLGCYGYPRNTSPEIDKLAKEGIIFKNMLAQTSWTRPGTASILSGLYPKNHGANTREDSLAEEINLLPEILGKYGYTSYAFVANGNAGLPVGFNQGYKKFFSFPERLNKDPLNIHVRSDMVNESLLKFIRKLEDTSNNFIYVHYMDPHAPYIPKEKHFSKSNKMMFPIDFFRSGTIHSLDEDKQRQAVEEMINAYDDEILYNDKMIGCLLQTLKMKNMYSNSIIIITSDHGEEFFEHGDLSHGLTLYDEQLKVPLIIRLPDKIHMTIDEIANQVDICPTVLSLLKIPIPKYIDGINLLNNKKDPKPYSYAELHKDRFVFSSIQTSTDKLIEGIRLPPPQEFKHRWFNEKAVIETGENSLELVVRSFLKDRTIRVLSDGQPVKEFVITEKKQVFNIPLPKSGKKKIVTIKSLTPCEPLENPGKNQKKQCLAFCIYNSRNVNLKNVVGEFRKEYYVLAEDPGEGKNQYKLKKFKKTIMLLRKKLKDYLLNKNVTPLSKKPVIFDQEQLKALKALGYI
ncbi:MAG: sulfatase [Candidatus Aminicenantes bacterium]|nr:MAG: sulfatase [Candidatus Aminicenantes bacterium]